MSTEVTLGELLKAVQLQSQAVVFLRKMSAKESRFEHTLNLAYEVFNHLVIELLKKHWDDVQIDLDPNRKFGKKSPHILVVSYENYKFKVLVNEIREINRDVVERLRIRFAGKQGASPRGFSASSPYFYILPQKAVLAEPELVLDRSFWEELDKYSFYPVDMRSVACVLKIGGTDLEDFIFHLPDGRSFLCEERNITPLPEGVLTTHNGYWFVITQDNHRFYSKVFGRDAADALSGLVSKYDGRREIFSHKEELPPHSGMMWMEPSLPWRPSAMKKIIRALIGENNEFLGLITQEKGQDYKVFVQASELMKELWQLSRLSEIVSVNLVPYED